MAKLKVDVEISGLEQVKGILEIISLEFDNFSEESKVRLQELIKDLSCDYTSLPRCFVYAEGKEINFVKSINRFSKSIVYTDSDFIVENVIFPKTVSIKPIGRDETIKLW